MTTLSEPEKYEIAQRIDMKNGKKYIADDKKDKDDSQKAPGSRSYCRQMHAPAADDAQKSTDVEIEKQKAKVIQRRVANERLRKTSFKQIGQRSRHAAYRTVDMQKIVNFACGKRLRQTGRYFEIQREKQ